MNYIHRLTQERDEERQRFQRIQDDLIDLQQYLGSAKFHQEDWVSAREMWTRIQQIRIDAWRSVQP